MQLDCLDLDQPREGWRRFLAAWLVRDGAFAFLVDPGPRSSAPALAARLRAMGVERLDLVLVTHIHLDHAGGLAEILDAFPSARVWAHPAGRPHLVDPARLWKGSVQVLGDVAHLYGEPRAIPESALADDAELAARGIGIVDAPGHAPHHACFTYADVLFAGEVFGTRLDLPGGRVYLRPATPPRLLPAAALASIERCGALDPAMRVAFAHHGLSSDPGRWASIAGPQLIAWIGAARPLRDLPAHAAWPRFRDWVLANDPHAGGEAHAALQADLRERELGFWRNTLEGMLECVRREA